MDSPDPRKPVMMDTGVLVSILSGARADLPGCRCTGDELRGELLPQILSGAVQAASVGLVPCRYTSTRPYAMMYSEVHRLSGMYCKKYYNLIQSTGIIGGALSAFGTFQMLLQEGRTLIRIASACSGPVSPYYLQHSHTSSYESLNTS